MNIATIHQAVEQGMPAQRLHDLLRARHTRITNAPLTL